MAGAGKYSRGHFNQKYTYDLHKKALLKANIPKTSTLAYIPPRRRKGGATRNTGYVTGNPDSATGNS